MIKYVLKRVGLMLLTLFLVTSITFFLVRLMPGSPFNDQKVSPDQLAVLEEKYGLNDPLPVQYARYMTNMVKGDFGKSFQSQREIGDLIGERLPTTTRIGLQALALGSVIGLGMGILAALKRNTKWDYTTTVIAVLGISVPSFVFAILLQLGFGVELKVLPVLFTRSKPFLSSILPTIALSVFVIATVARFMRTELIEVLNSDYVLLARAKGISRKAVIVKHAIRNALIPVVTIIGPMTVSLLTGSTVVERIFSVPGLGSLLVEGVQTNDYFVIAGVATFYSLLYLIAILVVDILYGVIDPRIRITGGKA